MLEPIHKNTVKKIIRTEGVWSGWIAPSNVNAFHVTGGWYLGYHIEVRSLEALEKIVNEFSYYNCNDAELGYRVRFWTR